MHDLSRALNDIQFSQNTTQNQPNHDQLQTQPQNPSQNLPKTNQIQPQNSQARELVSDDFRAEMQSLIRNLVRDSIVDYFGDLEQTRTPTIPPRSTFFQDRVDQRREEILAANSANEPKPVNNSRRSFPLLSNSVPNNPILPNFPNNPRFNDHSHYNPLKTKLEKWQIQFSGEPGTRSLSVGDFIRQVTILANANQVSNEQLLQQSHLFFTGEARRWYFT